MTSYTTVANSTYLDAYANQQATSDQFSQIAAANPASPDTIVAAQQVLADLFTKDATAAEVGPDTFTDTITVALVLNRAQPDNLSSLLSSDWSERQLALADQDTVWSTYGADPLKYATVSLAIDSLLGNDPIFHAAEAGYLSTAQDRTIWLKLTPAQFETLFNTDLLAVKPHDDSPFAAWVGNLSLPDDIAGDIGGLWVERGISILNPAILESDQVDPVPAPGSDSLLGIGNGLPDGGATPAAIAANYDFPLSGLAQSAETTTLPIGLIEANLPLTDFGALFENYNHYRHHLGLPEISVDDFLVLPLTSDETAQRWLAASELALDISVIAGAAPTSPLRLYTYVASQSDDNSPGTVFNAYQRAFFDVDHAGVVSSSYPVAAQPTANSPFQWAWQQLFIDGALKNISVHVSAGDQGSSGDIANGVANVPNSQAAPTALVVGGTSIADRYMAQNDVTLEAMATKALQGDPATIFSLVASGLTTLPSNLAYIDPGDSKKHPATQLEAMFETVWQRLQVLPGEPVPGSAPFLWSDFGGHFTGLGGVADGVPIPDYQSAFGLTPTSAIGTTGRGSPDVAALAGGDFRYVVLNHEHQPGDSNDDLMVKSGGTSAATPLWASLTAQLNTVFLDQHLPQLGYYNDLLYTAAAVAPASFNDILLGNNINSFAGSDFNVGYSLSETDPSFFTPTGQGYTAEVGYDLASGLGSPNGMILARTLTAIAHAQSYSHAPAMIDLNDGTSTVSQTLLVQNTSHSGALIQVDGTSSVYMAANSALGWTSRLAEQSVQGAEFDGDIVILLDGNAKSVPYQISVEAGDTLGVSAWGTALPAYQQSITNDLGFLQFGNAQGGITLARPVAIAQTANGASDQEAILRIRQDGKDSLYLEVYKVDSLNGTVNGYAPGQAGYAEQAASRDYHMLGGGTVIGGPGYGGFGEVIITGVNPDDIMAMKLTNATTSNTYWAFSQGNPEHVAAIFSYGLNTWSFEDRPITGDSDYNDLVVQFDFTSLSGHNLLT